MHARYIHVTDRIVIEKNIAYAIGGWKGESIKLSLNSALYSVKQLEDESTIC